MKYKRNQHCEHCGEFTLLLWQYGSDFICGDCENKIRYGQ